MEQRRADRGTRLREEVNDLLRAGLAASSRQQAQAGEYVLPTYDPGRALITDHRKLARILDDDDVDGRCGDYPAQMAFQRPVRRHARGVDASGSGVGAAEAGWG